MYSKSLLGQTQTVKYALFSIWTILHLKEFPRAPPVHQHIHNIFITYWKWVIDILVNINLDMSLASHSFVSSVVVAEQVHWDQKFSQLCVWIWQDSVAEDWRHQTSYKFSFHPPSGISLKSHRFIVVCLVMVIHHTEWPIPPRDGVLCFMKRCRKALDIMK